MHVYIIYVFKKVTLYVCVCVVIKVERVNSFHFSKFRNSGAKFSKQIIILLSIVGVSLISIIGRNKGITTLLGEGGRAL